MQRSPNILVADTQYRDLDLRPKLWTLVSPKVMSDVEFLEI